MTQPPLLIEVGNSNDPDQVLQQISDFMSNSDDSTLRLARHLMTNNPEKTTEDQIKTLEFFIAASAPKDYRYTPADFETGWFGYELIIRDH